MFEDAFGEGVKLACWEAQDFKALFTHESVAGIVVGRALGVGWTVEFDYEVGFRAVEIREVIADGVLAAKLQFAELAVPQELPESGFAFGLLSAEVGAQVEGPVLFDEVVGYGLEIACERFFGTWGGEE